MSSVVGPAVLDWQGLAACQSADPDLFFPVSGTGWAGQVEKAKALCAECPVRSQCLRYAISKNEDHGVWGGMTRDERIQVRWQAGDPPSGRPLPGRL
jgi:WhiB family transcriptional regulator, redox-sensing transcriptional regulator